MATYNPRLIFTALENKTAWTQAILLTIAKADIILKRIKTFFSPGCEGQVYVKYRINNISHPDVTVFESNTKLNSYLVGDDTFYDDYFSIPLNRGDTIEILYQNNDTSGHHDITVGFEFQTKRVVPEEVE